MDVNTGAEFRVTSVRILPGITGTEEQILKTIAKQLIETYDKLLQGWPSQVIVDGQKGVEAKYEGAVAFGQELVNIVGWEAVIVKGGKQWVLTVVGRTEYREELESIHSQFRLRFHVLPSP